MKRAVLIMRACAAVIPLFKRPWLMRIPVYRFTLGYYLHSVAATIISWLAPADDEPAAVGEHKMFLPQGPDALLALQMRLGEFEKATVDLLCQMIRPGMTVIDIGAHVGYFTLPMAKWVGPTGRVYAFEPEASNFSLLQRNVAVNGYRHVVAVQKCVTDKTGLVELFLSERGSAYHSTHHDHWVGRQKVVVEGITLDDFLEAEGWPWISLVKMDIEGGEAAALRGMSKLLRRANSLKLVVEFNPGRLDSCGVNPAEFVGTLAACGFEIRLIEDDGELRPMGSIVLAQLVKHLRRGRSTNLLCEK